MRFQAVDQWIEHIRQQGASQKWCEDGSQQIHQPTEYKQKGEGPTFTFVIDIGAGNVTLTK